LATPDAQGRYAVRFGGTTPGLPAKTPALRVAQLFAGSNEGSHFLLRDGAPVLVSYLEGDIDRPFIAAALPHAGTRHVVDDKHAHRSTIENAAGARIELAEENP
jgi:type VI secretion system secreted protein VgrG